MAELTAEILRDELQRHTDDILASLRLVLRKEIEQYFGGKAVLDKSNTLSNKKFSVAARGTSSSLMLPIDAQTPGELTRNSSVRFDAAFMQDDADKQLSAAIEPRVLHWKRSATTLGAEARKTRSSSMLEEAPKSQSKSILEDARPDQMQPRTQGTLSPPASHRENNLQGLLLPSSWKSDAPGPLSSAMGRRSWQSSHRNSFRQLGLVQEKLKEPASYQALPPSADVENKEDEVQMSQSAQLTRSAGNSRKSVGVGMLANARGSTGDAARPRRTMKKDSISTEGWMHRFRKGNGPAAFANLQGDILKHEEESADEADELDDEGNGDTFSILFRSCIESSMCWCFGVSCMEDMVASNKFNAMSGALVILNALSIGVQTDYMAVHWCQEVPRPFHVLELIFCILFSTELAIRLIAYGLRFWYMSGWRWNLFDTFMVVFQITEVCLQKDITGSDSSALSHFSSFRMLRSLGWVVLLLLVMIYVIAVYLTQIVTDHKVYASKESLKEEEALLHFYGSLDRSVLSLYAMVSEGIHWDQLMDPLAEHISPWLRLLFFFFSAFAIFAVMNVVTGVFVESALTTATEDRKVSITAQMRELFQKVDDDGSGDITWEEFQEHLSHPQMQACMKEIDVNNDDAHELFRLLDINSSGTIDIDELVHGCLRLMGFAKAIDLATFMNEYRVVTLRWARHARFVEECLDIIQTKLDNPARSDLSLDRASIQEGEEDEWINYTNTMSLPTASFSR